MYKKYNLTIYSNYDYIKKSSQFGFDTYKNYSKDVKRSMDTYIDSYGYLNGNKIKDDWFSTNSNKFNIFLSHSHKDFDLAVGLAGWLHKEFGLNVFIDSCVWEYSGDLKNKLIKEYCKSSSDTCDPEESLRIATHVDLMLASAITQMINETECIFFLNTSQSLNGSYLANGYNSIFALQNP